MSVEMAFFFFFLFKSREGDGFDGQLERLLARQRATAVQSGQSFAARQWPVTCPVTCVIKRKVERKQVKQKYQHKAVAENPSSCLSLPWQASLSEKKKIRYQQPTHFTEASRALPSSCSACDSQEFLPSACESNPHFRSKVPGT